MYWRVAVVDPDGNVGAFSKAKKFTLLARMQVQFTRPAAARRSAASSIVTVLNAKGKPVKGAAVRLARRRRQHRHAGGRTRRASCNFSVKPTRAGNLTATATKKLFKVGTGGRADLVVPAGCRADDGPAPRRGPHRHNGGGECPGDSGDEERDAR